GFGPTDARGRLLEMTEVRSVPLRSTAGRGLILATVLGSGMVFLDSTVVTVALPRLARELGGGLPVQQWVVNGYLLTLSSLLLLGGALGDRYGRRRLFTIGLVAFTVASLACGLAPTGPTLVVARVIQGIGGALLVPGSLALINSVIRPDDRGRAIGVWAGLSGVTTAVGPFVGGWLVDAVSWRLVFLLNIPLAVATLWATLRSVPETRAADVHGRPDFLGSLAVTLGLAGVTYALIEVPGRGWSTGTTVAAVGGVIGLVVFPFLETRVSSPVLSLELFRSRQFTGTNLTTLVVYGALGGATFLLTLQLQQSMGYSALEAGLALLPVTVLLLLLSSRMGGLATRIGPRLPMTVGPIVAGIGLGLMAFVVPGVGYWQVVLPSVVVFGLGLSITVAPLTTAVLAAVEESHVGTASGVNNAISRLAGLLAVAVLPPLAGLATGQGPLGPGFPRAMLIAAAACALGGLIAYLTVSPKLTEAT
ncbi:MAG TPA: DHA2 family efflux MFS transporter permease subunit, partial [Actinopolymorphaceae bacterium]